MDLAGSQRDACMQLCLMDATEHSTREWFWRDWIKRGGSSLIGIDDGSEARPSGRATLVPRPTICKGLVQQVALPDDRASDTLQRNRTDCNSLQFLRSVCDSWLLPRADRNENRLAAPVQQQQCRLVAVLINRRAQIVSRFDGLPIHLLNYVAALDTGFSGRTGGFDRRDHHARGSRLQL